MPLARRQLDAALFGVQDQASFGHTVPGFEDEPKLA